MTILIIGATGTLGRQIVKKALDENYSIKCLVRNFRRSIFLKDWGSDLIYGDLTKPSSIPLAFKNINIIIDSVAFRSDSNYNYERVQGFGRLAILEVSILLQIKKYIWFTFLVLRSKFEDQPLWLRLNERIKQILKVITFTYIIFECFAFYQGIIRQYAIPILNDKTIFVPKPHSIFDPPLPYIDSRDAAKSVVYTFNSSEYNNRIVSILNSNSEGGL